MFALSNGHTFSRTVQLNELTLIMLIGYELNIHFYKNFNFQMDLYRTECGTDNPLRCYVGDVSARVGTIGRVLICVY